MKVCLNSSGEGNEDSPKNLKNCEYAIYYPNNKTYDCIRCDDKTILDKKTHLCYNNYTMNLINKYPCNIENKGNNLNPIYTCFDKYYDKNYYFTLIINEKNETEFIESKYGLNGCSEAISNTSFINSKYNCTKCLPGYNLIYSKFYDQIMCYNTDIKEIIEEKEFPYELFNKTKDKMKANKGTCEKDYLFSPDGNYCYKCNDKII